MNVEIVQAKNGSPTIKVYDQLGRGVLLHSTYDPQSEAAKAIAGFNPPSNDIIIVFGFGLGYHVEALINKLGSQSRLFIVEGNPDIFKTALEVRDVSRILNNKQITVITGKDISSLSREFGRNFNITQEAGLSFFEHGPSVKVDQEFYQKVSIALRDVISLQLSDIATLVNFKDLWIKNNLLNLKSYIQSPGVKHLFNKFINVPAVIVSAGPSLTKNVDLLLKAKNKILIICVGTAIKALLTRGIKPDLVVSYDGGIANYKHFEGIDISHIPLVFDPMIHPEIIKQHGGTKFVLNIGNDITNWIEEQSESKGHVICGGSVATLALSLAVNMGCSPIALIGQDLSFPEGKTHAAGTVYEQNKVSEKEDELHYFYVPDNKGGKVLTNRGYYSFLVWFEMYIQSLNGDKKIINATEGGAKIEGAEVMTLDEYISLYGHMDIKGYLDILQEFKALDKVDLSKIKDGLRKVISSLNLMRKKSHRGAILAEELHELYVNGLSYNEEKIIKELNSIDGLLKAKQEEITFINQAMQEVLVRATRGLLSSAKEGENVKEKNIRVALLSKCLYQGIKETMSTLGSYFEEALASL